MRRKKKISVVKASEEQTQALNKATEQRQSTASQQSTPRSQVSRSPSGAAIAINPVPPGMKLRDNPAMAMSLAQSLPPGYHQGTATYTYIASYPFVCVCVSLRLGPCTDWPLKREAVCLVAKVSRVLADTAYIGWVRARAR